MREKQLGKFLSLVLRHKPETVGIALDEHGWANVDELLQEGQGTEMLVTLPRRICQIEARKNFKESSQKSYSGHNHVI